MGEPEKAEAKPPPGPKRSARRRKLLAFLVLILVGLVWLRFEVHYHILGVWRGDRYFAGRPTCYWNAEVHAYLEAIDSYEKPQARNKFIDELSAWLPFLKVSKSLPLPPGILNGRSDSAPVLFDMLADKSNPESVRNAAKEPLAEILLNDQIRELNRHEMSKVLESLRGYYETSFGPDKTDPSVMHLPTARDRELIQLIEREVGPVKRNWIMDKKN